MRYSKHDARPCGPTNTIPSPMPCGPVANRVPYPLVADGLSAGIPYATPVGGATDFIPCTLRPRPLLQSVAHPQVGVHSGYSRVSYAYARLAHHSPYLSLSRRVPTYATHEKRKLSLRIFQINRELTFGRTLILLTHRLAAAIPSMAVSVMPIPAWLSDASHEVILPEVIIVLHFFTMLVSPPHVPTFR